MPTPAQLKEWERDNTIFPDHLVPIAREHWPTMDGAPIETGSVAVGAFRSNAFVVVVWQEPNGFIRLSVNRTEWDDREGRFRGDISWDELQRLKAEAGYGDMPAVELYPPDGDVLNTVNMRHLFLLSSAPPFMWQRLSLSESTQ